MGLLIAIEGTDGAGKSTMADAVVEAWREDGISVGRLKFPRYGASPHADLIKEALYGRHGDLGESVYGMGALYALDRLQALPIIHQGLADHDVLLVDRYIASNAAYQAARLRQDANSDVVNWVRELEIERFGLPAPQAQILMNTPLSLAMERIQSRAQADPIRGADLWETDDALQSRCAQVYAQLADMEWLSPWRVLDGAPSNDRPDCPDYAPVDHRQLARDLLGP